MSKLTQTIHKRKVKTVAYKLTKIYLIGQKNSLHTEIIL